MTVEARHTIALPCLPRLPRQRAGRAGDTRWLEGARRALAGRLRDPLLRTLEIVELDLWPRGDVYWAAATRRVAVVYLAPGLCGAATARRLNAHQRAELGQAVAGLCMVDEVVLRAAGGGRAALADGLAVGGQLLALLGGIAWLSGPPTGVWLAIVALGAAAARAGYGLVPRHPQVGDTWTGVGGHDKRGVAAPLAG